VSLTITPPLAAPSITLNRTTLTATAAQGASPADDTFTVANGGTGTLDYAISCNAAWLTVSPANGSSTGAANTHTVQYDTASLAAGTYPATITVTAAGPRTPADDQREPDHHASAGGAEHHLEQDDPDRNCGPGASPADGTFTVASGGTGTLDYAISSNAAWLTSRCQRLIDWRSKYPHGAIRHRLTGRGYLPGDDHGDRRGATNTPQTISVSLTITAGSGGPGDPAAGQALYSQRCAGCHPSPAAIAGAASRITNDMGTVDPDMTGITLTNQQVADLKAYLDAGSTGAPTITLSRTALAPTAAPGASPASDSFTVANGGAGTLNYTITSSAAWLTVSPANGSSTGAANTHTVQYDTASLAAGTYPATITVNAAGARTPRRRSA